MMRRVHAIPAAAAAILILVAFGCGKEGGEGAGGGLTTAMDSMSYAVGMDVAGYVERIQAELNEDEVVQGLKDALEGDDTRLTPEKKTELMAEVIQKVREATSQGQTAAQVPPDASYAIGMDVASYIRNQMPAELNTDLIVRGLRDALGEEGQPMLALPVKDELVNRLGRQRQEARGAEAMTRGRQYLEQNRQKEGVQVTASGLQFEVLQEGTGNTPGRDDQVTVHYQGELVDGTVFDSSYQRGQPATFPVGGVIPGWTEALQKMKVGGRYRLVLPPEIAYGERGAGGQIGPNETLVFTVELIGIGTPEAGGDTAVPPPPEGGTGQ